MLICMQDWPPSSHSCAAPTFSVTFLRETLPNDSLLHYCNLPRASSKVFLRLTLTEALQETRQNHVNWTSCVVFVFSYSNQMNFPLMCLLCNHKECFTAPCCAGRCEAACSERETGLYCLEVVAVFCIFSSFPLFFSTAQVSKTLSCGCSVYLKLLAYCCHKLRS